EELAALEEEEAAEARAARDAAWEAYQAPIDEERAEVVAILGEAVKAGAPAAVEKVRADLERRKDPLRRDIASAVHQALVAMRGDPAVAEPLRRWQQEYERLMDDRYHSHLHSESSEAALNVPAVAPEYAD